MTTATRTVPMRADQTAECGAVLARAFADDPLFNWILQNEIRRDASLRWFMPTATRYGTRHGHVFTTDATPEGAAVWLPPGDVKVTMPRMVQSGLLLAPWKFGLGGFRRFLKAMDTFEHLHDRDMPMPHWYLMLLGVDPPRQGQGVGGTLLQPMLARADAEGTPCYLETQKAINVPFYQRHGFETVVELDMPDGGPHCWTMKRAPRS
jgi:GNAT superfamily N-acetyltransferase